ncbi:MAG: hypothetical protein ACI978_001407 [Oleispira sp.]|jgi:hypothetical protein
MKKQGLMWESTRKDEKKMKKKGQMALSLVKTHL